MRRFQFIIVFGIVMAVLLGSMAFAFKTQAQSSDPIVSAKVVADSVIFQSPSLSSQSSKITEDTIVTIFNREGDFYQITFQDRTGWVYYRQIRDMRVQNGITSQVQIIEEGQNRAVLRSGKGLGFLAVDYLENGEEVQVIRSDESGWTLVFVHKQTSTNIQLRRGALGYIQTILLDVPLSVTPEPTAEATTIPSVIGIDGIVNADDAIVRVSPFGDTVTTLSKDVTVKITGRNFEGSHLYIQYSGLTGIETGWIRQDLVDFDITGYLSLNFVLNGESYPVMGQSLYIPQLGLNIRQQPTRDAGIIRSVVNVDTTVLFYTITDDNAYWFFVRIDNAQYGFIEGWAQPSWDWNPDIQLSTLTEIPYTVFYQT